jgi:hypothetical protein
MSALDDSWHTLGFAEKQAKLAKFTCSHGIQTGYWCEACATHCRVKGLPYHGISATAEIAKSQPPA